MAEKNNATCDICGKPYHMCLSCKDTISANPWKIHCDTSEHYKVYQALHGYNTKVYTKDEAKTKLKNVDLSDLDSFRPHIKELVEDILKEPIIEKKVSRRRNNVEAEEKVVDEIIEFIETEQSV